MTNDDYATGIATIISDFRKKELQCALDVAHVRRWVKQFEETEQEVVLAETFHILSRWYFKEERIRCFLEQVIDFLLQITPFENWKLASVQKKGTSQKLLYDMLQDVALEKYGNGCSFVEAYPNGNAGNYVYVDDALYTGSRAKDDLLSLVEELPEGSTLYVFYMLVYSNGYNYWTQRIAKAGETRGVKVVFTYGKMLYNERNHKNERLDIIWPSQECRENPVVIDFENELKQTGKANYLYYNEVYEDNPGLCSSFENYKKISYIFVKYGIQIARQINKTTFRPLGLSNTPSFGFGSFCATDYNISNTCPLVLWWGTLEEGISGPVGCWYPLLPRRGNKVLYQEVSTYEENHSVFAYRDILKTVHLLAQERHIAQQKNKIEQEHEAGSLGSIPFDLKEIKDRREKSDLYQYLKTLNMNTIKVIQTVMYIGRDYRAMPLSDEIKEDYYEIIAEDPGVQMPSPRLQSDKPDELFLAWLADLEYAKGWKDKDVEIEQIFQKMPLDKYMNRAFMILGI